MKKATFVLSIFGLLALWSTQTSASSTPNLQMQIFPLECSLDTVALGNVNLLQLTPENCLPETPRPFIIGSQPLSSEENPPLFPRQGNTLFLNGQPLQIPLSNFPSTNIHSPLFVDPGERRDENGVDKVQTSIIITCILILLIAGFLATAHAIYTGILVPLIAQGNLLKLRFPWSKK